MSPISPEYVDLDARLPAGNVRMDSTMDHPMASPPLPIEIIQLIMDQLYNFSTPEHHCYRNQATYRHWSLVNRSWCPYAQTLLFRIVELTDTACLHRFAAVLDSAPHLADHVKFLRVYSRHLHTPENVLASLPVILGNRLTNLQELAVTRISRRDDVWHPHALLPPLPCELPYSYMPLPSHFFDALPVVSSVTVVKIHCVTFESFGDFARTLHALTRLRRLICVNIRWRRLDELPAFMVSAQTAVREPFLPELQDLTVSSLNVHGTERLLSALHRSPITKLSIDYPTHPWTGTFNLTDPSTGHGLGVDLYHFPHIQSLSVSMPYMFAASPDLSNKFASLLRSWNPGSGSCEGTRTLMITPSYEYDCARESFANILRALGPVTEHTLLDEDATHPSGTLSYHACASQKGFMESNADSVVVEVCIIDREDYRRGGWQRVARECFPRLHEQGRLRSTFSKEDWDYWEWKDLPSKSANEVARGPSVEGELSPNGTVPPDGMNDVHPGAQRAPDEAESMRSRRGIRIRNAKLRKQLKRPLRALAGIIVHLRIRLKLGTAKAVAARPREA